MDARDDLGPHSPDQPGRAGPAAGPTAAAPGGAGWYRRPWGIALIAAVSVLAVVGVTVGAMALADGDDDDPPVATSPSPTPTRSPTPSPSATPTPTPTQTPTTPATEEPEPEDPPALVLDACGIPAPQGHGSDDPWVGDYGGGVDADVSVPLNLSWQVITGQDWGGQTVTSTVTGLWLVTEGGAVVAVPEQLPGPVAVAMTSGSEGGGGGSEGTLTVATTFLTCPGGSGTLQAGQYRARVSVTIQSAAGTVPGWGDIPVFLPDYATATGS